MFERFSPEEKRRLRVGAVLVGAGSLLMSVGAFPSPSPLELAVYFGGALACAALAALLTLELRGRTD